MKFEKVTYREFKRHTDSNMHCGADEYDNIIMPERKTKGSAGYDIASPVNITIPGGCKRIIPSGIKVQIDDGWSMELMIRSHMGIDKDLELATGVSLIDSDYYDNEKNEGHIMIPLRNKSTRPVFIAAGERIVQGVFRLYGITEDDDASGKRTGGIGSTDEQ